MGPYQLGPGIDVNALVERIVGGSVIAMLAGSLLLYMIGRVVGAVRAPKQAQNLSTTLAQAFAPITDSLKFALEQSNQREIDSMQERKSFLEVLSDFRTYQNGSEKRHEAYLSPIVVTMRDIAQSIAASNETLAASNAALLAEIKVLRASLGDEAARNREHVSSTLANKLAPVQGGVEIMTEQLNDMRQDMEKRAEKNGAVFTALQTGLTNLKAEVVKLASATHEDHELLKRDVLLKIDGLANLLADLVVQITNSLPDKPFQGKPLQPTGPRPDRPSDKPAAPPATPAKPKTEAKPE